MDVIIGAGVSGISYANYTNNNCLIIEKENEIGGYCRTIKRSGFVWDYSGHFFHFCNPEIESEVCENIPKETLYKVEKHTSILYKGRYIDFPFQKNIHQLNKEEFIDCLYDLFAATTEKKAVTFKDMIYTNLGKSIAEKFLIPYNEKLYACDLDLLDSDAMGRFFPKASKEEIILNFKDKDSSSYNQYFTYPKGGAIEYINSLRYNIPNTPINLNEEIISIDIANKTVTTNSQMIKYDNLISTIPLPKLLEKCDIDFNKDIYTCNKVLVFNIGFDKKGADTVNSWVYVPDKEIIFYRIGYYDNILSMDRMSLYVEIGFKENDELQDHKIYLDIVLKDLKRLGIIDDHQVVDYTSIVMNPAYVHINKSSSVDIVKQKAILAQHNIYSIGRYGSWTYCSIEDNIIEAKQLATKINTP